MSVKKTAQDLSPISIVNESDATAMAQGSTDRSAGVAFRGNCAKKKKKTNKNKQKQTNKNKQKQTNNNNNKTVGTPNHSSLSFLYCPCMLFAWPQNKAVRAAFDGNANAQFQPYAGCVDQFAHLRVDHLNFLPITRIAVP